MENIQGKYKNLISAEIIKDSLNEFGDRLTTFKLVFPRYILAELNTHRLFSKNSASSRAIPFEKMVKSVTENPFTPIAWQKDHKGMQGTEYFIKEDDINGAISEWIESRDGQTANAKQLNKQGVTKQLCNRLLEPFLYHTVLLSGTEFENFFNLRCPKYVLHEGDNKIFKSWKEAEKEYPGAINSTLLDKLKLNKGQADIHIMDLAEKMYDAYNESKPERLGEGEWHIPFAEDKTDLNKLADLYKPTGSYDPNNPPPDSYYEEELTKIAIKIATARCARISYKTLGDNPVIDYEKDIKLHDDLLAMGHMSPFEHCARVMSEVEYAKHIKGVFNPFTVNEEDYKGNTGWSRNFKGFQQYRELVENV